MMWFEELTGFTEENPKQVRENIEIKGSKLISKVNSAVYNFGMLEVVSLGELKNRCALQKYNSQIQVEEVIGNVQMFHNATENNGAVFQAASQFNLLEMVSPVITPEHGVSIYGNDHTQGPSCAIACGAGTIYRNYFANVNGQIGQSANNQINCLQGIDNELNNSKLKLWQMSNGYAILNNKGLKNINKQLYAKSEKEFENIEQKLKIGLQCDTDVTIGTSNNRVTQAYCSALPIAYSNVDIEESEKFAQLILDATYQATFYAALINYEKTGNSKLFLTLVGGGVFGNKIEWIISAIKKSIYKFWKTPLDVKIISYGNSKTLVQNLIETI